MMSWGALIDAVQEDTNEPTVIALETVDVVYEASDPGHVVFGQYITSDNCGFCMDYGSPAHKKLKADWPDKYTYVSLHSASYGDTDDAESGNVNPILAVNHLGETGGAPKTSFGDAQSGSGSSFMTGCGSNTCWDTGFNPNGRTHSSVADYSLGVAQSDNGDGTSTITISADYVGVGMAPISSYTLYAAVTEEVCHSHAYTNGYKGGHCWEAWLLNGGAHVSNSGNVGGGTGFQTFSLGSGSVSYSWTVSNSLVAQGSSNMLIVAALYSGWSNSGANYDVFTASDSSMNPMDLSVTDFTVTNDDSPSVGFQTGDTLTLDAVIGNTGTEDYSDGGSIQFYKVTGMNNEQTIGPSISLNNLNVGQTQSVSAQFDTSGITMTNNGATTFRVKLYSTQGEKDPVTNNMEDIYVAHDVAPSTSRPVATGSTAIDRGASLDFEVSGQSNDQVDDMGSMSGEMQTSVAGQNAWISDWVSGGELMGAGTGNERFVFTVSPPSTAGSGDYDVRARLTDARGQIGDWSQVTSNAFSLMNGLPMVVDPSAPGEIPASCPTYPGQPTVKVETIERINLAGLICDAETPLSDLVISSNNPAFRQWDPSTGEVEVMFDQVITNPSGEVLAQPMQFSISDGEDTNSGTLNIMVIENGAPRWASLPQQTFNEGGSTSLILTPYLTDTNSEGVSVPVTGHDHTEPLSLSIVDVGNNSLLSASMNGHTINIDAVNDDVFGSTVMTIRAADADGQFADTQLWVNVANVNDAPTLDVSAFDGLRLKIGEVYTFDVPSNLYDVDDSQYTSGVTFTCDTCGVPGGEFSTNPVSRWHLIDEVVRFWFSDAGTHTMTIIVADSHDAATAYDVTIEVIDNLPLVWSDNPETGDLMIEESNIYVGENPAFIITEHSDLGLTDIDIEWQICNMDTGVCTDFGKEVPTSFATPFEFQTNKPGGAMFRDYVKVVVTAVDGDGFDRTTDGSAKYDITTERPVVNDTPEDDGSNTDAADTGAAGNPVVLYAIAAALFVGLLVAITLAVMLVRGGREEEIGMGYGDADSLSPAAGLGSVPDYTQLPTGGSYVTAESGQTVYLAPNDTDWTMQTDNSFTRTR